MNHSRLASRLGVQKFGLWLMTSSFMTLGVNSSLSGKCTLEGIGLRVLSVTDLWSRTPPPVWKRRIFWNNCFCFQPRPDLSCWGWRPRGHRLVCSLQPHPQQVIIIIIIIGRFISPAPFTVGLRVRQEYKIYYKGQVGKRIHRVMI